MLASYRELTVWQVGMEVVVETYSLTRKLPGEERFGLCSQARRAAVSVPANIAEGRAQFTLRGYLRHLGIARGSLAELETHLLLTSMLGLLDAAEVARLMERTGRLGRMLNTMIRRLRTRAQRDLPTRGGSSRHPPPATQHPNS